MKISDEKSKFFMQQVEYLGHLISNGKIKVDPKKVETIENYPVPKTLKQLRSFLGLSGYYRKFIRNYAQICKPLTVYLRDENGRVSAKHSANVKIELDQAAIDAFNEVKEKLKENIELFQPDYSKPFELTTDASNSALGSVLSQNRQPIIFISRTLNKTEQNYATNEKEALAIVWSLQHLRNYIYGIADLTIYTDHQPLTFAISEKNPNLKIKRWKNMIEESGAKLVYKPGKENVVADALSRQFCNATGQDDGSQIDSDSDPDLAIPVDGSSTTDTAHSRGSSAVNEIPRTAEPLNAFRTQIELERSNQNFVTHTTIFPNYLRYHIRYNNIDSAVVQMKFVVNKNNINALHLNPEEECELIPRIKAMYPEIKFLITKNKIRDITDVNKQQYLVMTEHNRAHRGPKENYMQLKQQCFWPNLRNNVNSFSKTCEICLKNKYERHPTLQEIGETPIPKTVGEMLHIDIFFLENNKFLTCQDKFSKFLQIFHLRSNTEVPKMIEQIMVIYPNCSNATTDNESVFTSQVVSSVFRRYKVTHHTTPVSHSITNGQVERVHSTLLELARTLAEQQSESIIDIVFQAVREYNNTFHSVTKQKPSELLYHSDKYPEIGELLKKAQEEELRTHNKKRSKKEYNPGDVIFVKTDRRNKSSPRYIKHTVKTDNKETITTTRDKVIHKDSIRK